MRFHRGAATAASVTGSTLAAAWTVILALLATSPARSETALEASYAISLGGVTIGTADVDGLFTGVAYTARITGKTSGVSRLMSDARAQLVGEGRISRGRVTPRTYELETREGEFETHVRMKMRAEAISDLLVIPRIPAHPDRIPVEREHRRNVVDPVAAFLVVSDTSATGDGRRICQRTINVFDGWQRYDIRLSYKQTRTVEGDDYNGRVVACAARYVPVSGHRMSLKSTRYMAENKRIEVWYAPVGSWRLLFPYRILIGTAYGDLVVAATRFAVAGGDGKAATEP